MKNKNPETANENKKEKRLVTSALPYINNLPHLGHIVGSHLPADVFARFSRLRGYETVFVGGTDDHGSASEIAAEKLGIEINKFAKKLNEEHAKIYRWFNISYDNFSRTSSETHYETTKDFFRVLDEKGFIEEDTMKVFYSPEEDRFLADRYVEGECPECGFKEANADQCEKCTSLMDPTKLINPHSKISGKAVELKETRHLFFRLDKVSNDLDIWIKSNTHWKKQVSSLALSWIKKGLKKRPITRDLKNGIPVPKKGYEDKVFYVWFEAPIGYLSATKELRKDWEKFWIKHEDKDKENSKIFNFLGKDNIPFHTIFWPGTQIAHEEIKLAYNVIGMQYFNYQGGKFSKSKKRGVFCGNLSKTGISPDIWRAYLIHAIPEKADTEFRWDDFKERINSDLIGNFGNYINRSLSFVFNKFDGAVEKPDKNDLEKIDENFIEKTNKLINKITNNLENCNIREAYNEFLELSTEGNKYLSETAPWELVKKDQKRAEVVLYNCLELTRKLAVVCKVFIPDTSDKIWKSLDLNKDEKNWDNVFEKNLIKKYALKKPEKLFQILTDEKIEEVKELVKEPLDIKDLF